MMIIDGEELNLKCLKCNKVFKHIIGYGPICPSPYLRKKILKENPPKCPFCGSSEFKRETVFDKMIRFINIAVK